MERHSQETERRHFARVAMDTPATLELADSRRDVTVLDISLKGAMVQLNPSDPSIPAHATGTGRLSIELAPGAEITMECRIAHETGGQIGLHCNYIDIDSVSHLRRLIELNLGDPELLNRELAELASPDT